MGLNPICSGKMLGLVWNIRGWAQPRWGCLLPAIEPKVVASLQPWAGGLSPFGAGEETAQHVSGSNPRQLFIQPFWRNGKRRAQFLGEQRDFVFLRHPAIFVKSLLCLG